MDKLESIKDQIGEIKSDVREIKTDLAEIKTTMAVNTASLEYHVTRTNQLQDIVTNFNDELLRLNESVSSIDLQYKKHLAIINGGLKVIVGLAAILVFLKEVGLLDRLF